MTFNNYSGRGRTLLVKFTCRRCGFEKIDPLEAHKDDDPRGYGYLHYIDPPAGWREIMYGPMLLCPACIKALENFMKN